jgi:hypothetical protein
MCIWWKAVFGAQMVCAPRYDPKHGKLRGYLLELGQRCVLVNGHMRSRAWRPLQVDSQHGGTPLHGHLFQAHLFAPPMPERNIAIRRLHIAHPARLRSEHGHQVTLPVDDHHDERETDHAPGASAAHLQSDEIVRRHAECVEPGPAPVEYACHPVGAPIMIEPFLQIYGSRK